MNPCEICNNSDGNDIYTAREMMFGFRDEFEYMQCSNCGCLQLLTIPENLSKYYPCDYFSFKQITSQAFKDFLKRRVARDAVKGNDVLGKLLVKVLRMPAVLERVLRAGAGFTSDILDVGCGRGRYLKELHNMGFSNLTGIDPHIEDDIFYENGITIYRKELSEINRRFDLLLLQHSFEHMPRPLGVFRELYRILRPEGCLLIVTPLADSYAWQEYGVNWVQLDAPRHLFLHTSKSIEILATTVGFDVSKVVYDSKAFQFWGSEQYRQDIPLTDPSSHWGKPRKSLLSRSDIKRFERMARELNKRGEGDSASFYLSKA